jgi:hypothetical protein
MVYYKYTYTGKTKDLILLEKLYSVILELKKKSNHKMVLIYDTKIVALNTFYFRQIA